MAKKEREEHEKEVLESLLQKGQRQISRKEYKDAIRTFEKALRYQPDNKKAENFMISAQNMLDKKKGKKLMKKHVGKPEKKVAAPKKAVNKKQAEKLYNEGIQLYTEGSVNQAVKKWKKAISLNPSHTKARNALRRNGKM